MPPIERYAFSASKLCTKIFFNAEKKIFFRCEKKIVENFQIFKKSRYRKNLNENTMVGGEEGVFWGTRQKMQHERRSLFEWEICFSVLPNNIIKRFSGQKNVR